MQIIVIFLFFVGTSNILLIVSSQNVSLTDVQLESQNGNTDFLEPISLYKKKSINATEYLYETKGFDPPDFPFKIVVNGYSEKANKINRLISTTLQLLDGPPPELLLNATSSNIMEGEPLLLNCTVNSLLPYTIEIQHERKPIKILQSK